MKEIVAEETTSDKQQSHRKVEVPRNETKISSGKKKIKTLVIFLLALALWLALVQYLVAEKYSAAVRVVGADETAMIGADLNNVDFGNLPRGGSSVRFVTIKNEGDGAIYVRVLKSGSIGKLIKINPKGFVLQPGETEKVEVLLEASADTSEKEYGGKITIFKTPKIF